MFWIPSTSYEKAKERQTPGWIIARAGRVLTVVKQFPCAESRYPHRCAYYQAPAHEPAIVLRRGLSGIVCLWKRPLKVRVKSPHLWVLFLGYARFSNQIPLIVVCEYASLEEVTEHTFPGKRLSKRRRYWQRARMLDGRWGILKKSDSSLPGIIR